MRHLETRKPLCLLLVLGVAGCSGDSGSTEPPPTPTALAFSVPPSAIAQNRVAWTTQPVVVLRDAQGRTVAQSGVTVTASVPQGSSVTLTGGVSASTGTDGMAVFTDLTLRGKAGVVPVAFSAGALSGVAAEVTVTAGSPAILLLATGDDQNGTVGLPLPVAPSVRLLDADSNGVPGRPVGFTTLKGGGSVTTPTATTDASGGANPGAWTMGPTAGPNTLTVAFAEADFPGEPVSLWAYAFPTFRPVVVHGAQAPFASGVTFNRAKDRLTLAFPGWGLGELAPGGGQWTRYGETTPGGGRVYAAVHEARQQVVTLSDAAGAAHWSHPTGAWVTAPAGAAPSARQFTAMVYDSLRSRVLVYGGIVTGGSSNPVAELWAWDGDRWTALPDPPPGNRAGHRMAADPSSGRIFVHGGVDLGNPFGGRAVRDTWVLHPDGNWERLAAEHPRPLAAFCMTYEASRETLVVLGGTTVGGTGYGASTEVWEFIDGGWRRSPVPTPVGWRVVCSADYVPSIRGILLYGSEHAGWNDVWSYR